MAHALYAGRGPRAATPATQAPGVLGERRLFFFDVLDSAPSSPCRNFNNDETCRQNIFLKKTLRVGRAMTLRHRRKVRNIRYCLSVSRAAMSRGAWWIPTLPKGTRSFLRERWWRCSRWIYRMRGERGVVFSRCSRPSPSAVTGGCLRSSPI